MGDATTIAPHYFSFTVWMPRQVTRLELWFLYDFLHFGMGPIECSEISHGHYKLPEVHNDETIYPKYSNDCVRVAALLRHRFGGTDNYRQREWNGD
jgi:hypothetical protein